MGIAVLDGRQLIYHGVKTLGRHPSPYVWLGEGRRIVLRLLSDFRPSVLAVEKPFFAQDHNAALLNVLVDEMRSIAAVRGLEVRALAPSTIRKRVCGDGRADKRRVAQTVVAKYPDLKVYLGQSRRWQERYHGNMFDAVAVGLAAETYQTGCVSGSKRIVDRHGATGYRGTMIRSHRRLR